MHALSKFFNKYVSGELALLTMSVYMGWWENRLAYYTEISLDSSEIPPTGLAACPYKRKEITKKKTTIQWDLACPAIPVTWLTRLKYKQPLN